MLCIGRHAIYYKLLSKGRLQLYFKKVNSLKNKSVILNFIECIRKIPINFLAEEKKKWYTLYHVMNREKNQK